MRNRGGDVLNRVEGGEHVTVTRSGRPVAELRPVRQTGLFREVLIARRRHLPLVDPARLRADVDDVIDRRL